MKWKMWKQTVAVALSAIGLALSLPVGSNANLVTNGDFETNGGNGQIGHTTTATGWSLAGSPNYTFLFNPGTADTSGANGQYGGLSLWGPNNGSANGLPAASPSGGAYIAQDSDFQQNAIQQTINGLVVGQQYNLGFDWAAAQQYGFNGATSSAWQVSLGSETYDTGNANIPNHGFSGWMHDSMTFTATSTSEVLSFYAHGGPPVPPFALLDGVTMDAATTATPAPSSLVMSLVMFGMFGAVWGYKRFKGPVAAV